MSRRTAWTPVNLVPVWLGAALLAGWFWLGMRDTPMPVWLAIVLAVLPVAPFGVRLMMLRGREPAEEPGAVDDFPLRLGLILVAAGIASLSFVMLSEWMFDVPNPSGAWRLVAALVPVPVYMGLIGGYVVLLGRVDEFRRRLVLETLAIAYPAATVVAFTVDMLQRAGFLGGWTVGDVLWPWMAGMWLPALAIAWWRYR